MVWPGRKSCVCSSPGTAATTSAPPALPEPYAYSVPSRPYIEKASGERLSAVPAAGATARIFTSTKLPAAGGSIADCNIGSFTGQRFETDTDRSVRVPLVLVCPTFSTGMSPSGELGVDVATEEGEGDGEAVVASGSEVVETGEVTEELGEAAETFTAAA